MSSHNNRNFFYFVEVLKYVKINYKLVLKKEKRWDKVYIPLYRTVGQQNHCEREISKLISRA